MYTSGTEQMGVEQADRVLGVSREASAGAIKQSYRKLVKRWHPDLYKAGTGDPAEASQMTRLLNEAYSVAKHAAALSAQCPVDFISPNRMATHAGNHER